MVVAITVRFVRPVLKVAISNHAVLWNYSRYMQSVSLLAYCHWCPIEVLPKHNIKLVINNRRHTLVHMDFVATLYMA
jgi:hypothetical protein